MQHDRFTRPISELMERDVLTVTPETSVFDIRELFADAEIHGAPVVDEDGAVLGVVSSLDVLRVAEVERQHELCAADVMTRELVTVTPTEPIAEVARLMHDQHVHRVLVISDHELVGVVSTFDVLKLFARAPARAGQAIDFDPSA
jgi:CBS domain-containing protein